MVQRHPTAKPASDSLAAVAVIDRAIALADQDAAVSMLVERCDDAARAAARQCAAQGGVPIPITIKANMDVAGMVSNAGSPALADRAAASQDAPAVAALRSAGYVPIGHSNMTELAFSGLGVNPTYGTPDNPATSDRGRIPGGSSSGAAVSVALDIVPVAIGTDTGGSVRIPAAFCGLFGFKPTADTISREGVIPLSPTLDAVGIIGRTLTDCGRAFAAMRRDRPMPPPRRSRLRLALIEDYVLEGTDAIVIAAYDRALSRLSDAGVEIVRCPFPELDSLPERMAAATFPAYEAHARFADLVALRGDRMDPLVRQRIEAGSRMTEANYHMLCEWRGRFVDLWSQRIGSFDALIMPTVPIIAPTYADASDPALFPALNALVLRNPTIVNLADGCAISVPCQMPGEMPVGLTFAQRCGADDHLLHAAAEVAGIVCNADNAQFERHCNTDLLVICS